ncbi:MAG: hypothetical protein DMG60_05605, partial [Acidobacteria bacterium]
MKHSLAFSLLIISALGLHISGQTPKSGSQELLQKLTRHSSMPSGDLNGLPESAAMQMRRETRETRWKPSTKFNVSDPAEQETVEFAFVDSVNVLERGQKPDPNGLPVSSTAIVIGTVKSAKAFAKQDRTNVYSDYQVTVDETLKQDSQLPIVTGKQIVAYMPGGTIRFSSGHVVHYLISGRGFPEVGSQYVFFLERKDSQILEYEINTGYLLENGVIEPMDGTGDSPG